MGLVLTAASFRQRRAGPELTERAEIQERLRAAALTAFGAAMHHRAGAAARGRVADVDVAAQSRAGIGHLLPAATGAKLVQGMELG